MVCVNDDLDKFYVDATMPYKGFLEERYAANKNIRLSFLFANSFLKRGLRLERAKKRSSVSKGTNEIDATRSLNCI